MKISKKISSLSYSGYVCLAVFFLLFGYLASQMGTANMLNTIMKTAHDLLLNTVFYLMAICVITGAIGKVFVEFGVVKLLEKLLRPLMKPLFNLPGVASLGAVLTFLSDNPAIISLAQDKRFATYFKKYQFISLTNFGTAFGMGLLVIVFMLGQGYYIEPFVGLFGAFAGCVVSTRLMQRFVLKACPSFKDEDAATTEESAAESDSYHEKPLFQRILDSLLDGGRTGVDVGLAIIPGVLVISTLVMLFTFGPSKAGDFTGAAYEGVQLLPWVGEKLGFIFEWLFGFTDPHLIAFPITALGAVGAALGLVPNFAAAGWIDGNAIAVFTAIGMCWSGYLSTHTAMLDSLGYRNLTSKAILAHTFGGLVAGIVAHWVYMLVSLLFFSSAPMMLEDGKALSYEWSVSSLKEIPVNAESPSESRILFGELDVNLPQDGAVEVNFKNNTAGGSICLLGVDVYDDNGKALSASYRSSLTNDSTGCGYILEGVPAGKALLKYYVKGGSAPAGSGGTVTLCYSSQRSVVAKNLRALLDKAGKIVAQAKTTGSNESSDDAMLAAVLGLMCDKYEALLASPSATTAELEAACGEMMKVIGVDVE